MWPGASEASTSSSSAKRREAPPVVPAVEREQPGAVLLAERAGRGLVRVEGGEAVEDGADAREVLLAGGPGLGDERRLLDGGEELAALVGDHGGLRGVELGKGVDELLRLGGGRLRDAVDDALEGVAILFDEQVLRLAGDGEQLAFVAGERGGAGEAVEDGVGLLDRGDGEHLDAELLADAEEVLELAVVLFLEALEGGDADAADAVGGGGGSGGGQLQPLPVFPVLI